MIAITSFSPNGYEIYGKKFLKSAVENWPTDIVVYFEEKPDFEHPKIIYKNLYDCFGLKEFIAYCHRNPVFSGQLVTGYNFNFDAVKFAKKAFAQFDALQKTHGKVFWLDADMVFKKPVPVEFLTDVFHDKPITLLWRDGFHVESGFVGFDTTKAEFEKFLKTYIDIYRKGILFTLKQWIDGKALDEAVRRSGISFHSLSPDFPKHGIHVMPHSVLGDFITHNKGNLKYAALSSH